MHFSNICSWTYSAWLHLLGQEEAEASGVKCRFTASLPLKCKHSVHQNMDFFFALVLIFTNMALKQYFLDFWVFWCLLQFCAHGGCRLHLPRVPALSLGHSLTAWTKLEKSGGKGVALRWFTLLCSSKESSTSRAELGPLRETCVFRLNCLDHRPHLFLFV